MNTFEQIDETKLRVRIADVKPDSDDVKLCVDIIDMGAYKCKRFDVAMIKPDEAITDVPVVNAGLVDLTLKLLLVSIPGLIWFLDIRCGFKDLLIVHMAGKLELSLLTEYLTKISFIIFRIIVIVDLSVTLSVSDVTVRFQFLLVQAIQPLS